MSGNQPPSALRYLVQPIAYGVTDSERRASWTVVDTRPECEHYTTQAGVELLEERPPVWRQVAYCIKQGHAEMIRDALNSQTLSRAYDTYVKACHGRAGVYISEYSYNEWLAVGQPKGPRL